MLLWIVEGYAAIKMRQAVDEVTGRRQGDAHNMMAHHPRNFCSLTLGECQKLGRKVAHNVAVEREVVRDPKTEEDRK